MAMVKKVRSRELFMGKLIHGSDVLEAFDGPTLERALDETTGLPLWPLAD